MRNQTAKLTGMTIGDLKVNPAEIGGGFGGKTIVYLEPVALTLSKLSGHPVRMNLSREEVFKGTGPTSGASMTVKIGVKRDGAITAAEAILKYQAGAFPGSPVMNGCMCAFAPYDIPHQRTVGYDVVSNRPKAAAYRAPGSPISAYAVESTMDVAAKTVGMDPLEFRLKNAATPGTQMVYGPKLAHGGYVETVQALLDHPGYHRPARTEPGARVGVRLLVQRGGGLRRQRRGQRGRHRDHRHRQPRHRRHPGVDGDHGGRDPRHRLRPDPVERGGYRDGAVLPRHRRVAGDLRDGARGHQCLRADHRRSPRAGRADVGRGGRRRWCGRTGCAKPASSNVGDFEPLSLKDIASKFSATGGPIGATGTVNAGGQAPGFSTQFCDVEVDPETGRVTILRFVIAQDAGRAIHPSYVEGQMQGGVVQGIGWALNEEYIYDADGRLSNPGFLDYRVPVASDVPMIEPIVVEVPNPNHPYGVKGVGEVSICPPMAAIANAVADAIGRRMQELPMSPPKVLEALDHRNGPEL